MSPEDRDRIEDALDRVGQESRMHPATRAALIASGVMGGMFGLCWSMVAATEAFGLLGLFCWGWVVMFAMAFGIVTGRLK